MYCPNIDKYIEFPIRVCLVLYMFYMYKSGIGVRSTVVASARKPINVFESSDEMIN